MIAALLGRSALTVRGCCGRSLPLPVRFLRCSPSGHPDARDAAALLPAPVPTVTAAVSALMAYAPVLGGRFAIASPAWHVAALAASGLDPGTPTRVGPPATDTGAGTVGPPPAGSGGCPGFLGTGRTVPVVSDSPPRSPLARKDRAEKIAMFT